MLCNIVATEQTRQCILLQIFSLMCCYSLRFSFLLYFATTAVLYLHVSQRTMLRLGFRNLYGYIRQTISIQQEIVITRLVWYTLMPAQPRRKDVHLYFPSSVSDGALLAVGRQVPMRHTLHHHALVCVNACTQITQIPNNSEYKRNQLETVDT